MGYARRIEVVNNARDRALTKLADEVRAAVVLPACRRYGLIFLSGNGSYAFYDERYPIHDHRHIIHDAHDARRCGFGLARVFKILALATDRHVDLGCWVDSVQAHDLSRGS